MIFNITVLKSATTSKNGANGKPIQTLELTYTNGTSGAIESKKLVIFYNKVVCNALANAKMDDVYTITSEKEGDFWVWKEAVQAAPGQATQAQDAPNAPAKAAYTPASKSTYETPSERAEKQVYIVKQSSIAQAVALLTIGAKQPPSTALILQQAQEFVDFVFAKETPKALIDMVDDLPD